ncbi:LacI family DNA-binding transcriptional regulator [Bifidobacterium sp. ESL0704]|uniref:LacI family DNA-binding transcriptional regulator n=1 Tax=Bifidobacterium sp. ESL0704 TaxID=2983219 RepID=UPI0023F9565D|nr:LacI family DNA-binding transcriptional regulator [Bifidobacterium sp. ESL0704]WEV52852.1 LacI family DNA-binding transcriptional regulator [Bifidobacterium sp. ESL0704]
MTTIKEVAKEAGASVTAVSMALNHRENGHVKKELAKHIRKIAKEMGYRPNPLARSLRTSHTRTIGFISEEIATTPYAGEMILGAQDATSELGYMMLLVNADDEGDEAGEIDALRRYGVDGYLYAKMYDRISSIPKPLSHEKTVLIDATSSDESVPYIVPDEVAMGYDATTYLIESGARRIAYIGCCENLLAEPLRLRGYRKALREAGLPFDPELIASVANNGVALKAVSELFDRAHPDAFFCFNDARTWYVYQCAAQRGLEIGRDISVVGIDNNRIIKETFEPRPTTIALPHYEMGYWGARKLISMIEDRDLRPTDNKKTVAAIPALDAPNPVRIRCTLLERGSVANRGSAINTSSAAKNR